MGLEHALAGILAVLLAGCAGPASDSPAREPVTAAVPMEHAPAQQAPAPLPACREDEVAVFSCSIGPGSGIALCGSANLARLQYRESSPGTGTQWPANDAATAAAFRSGTMMYSGGGGAYLRFDRDGQLHTLYTGIGRGWEKAGLLVQEDGRALRKVECEGDVVSIMGPVFFDQASIPADDSGFDIP